MELAPLVVRAYCPPATSSFVLFVPMAAAH